MLSAANLQGAADLVAGIGGNDSPPVRRLLGIFGLTAGSGDRHAAALLRLAARQHRVFAARPVDAPGATLIGAQAGDGAARVSFAGIGSTAWRAFCRALGEAAEYEAMHDHPDRPVPTLPAGVLRRRGVPPRKDQTSTGFAAHATAEAAAAAAVCEVVERDAILRWFVDGVPPRAMTVAAEIRVQERHIRAGGQMTQWLQLPAIPGFVVAAALSRIDGRRAVGYGCARHAGEATAKALRELLQAEFALRLELSAAERGEAAPADGFLARAGMFDTRPELFAAFPPDEASAADETLVLDAALARAGLRLRLTDMTVPSTGVPVAHAAIPGLRDIAAALPRGAAGPI